MQDETPTPKPSTRNAVEDAIERAKSDVRWGQVSMPELNNKSSSSSEMLRCAGCGGRYEDMPGNYCSFCL